jgi:hypothetical protein
VNDITAKKNADASVTIQFGGCDGNIPNCLPIMEGWNHVPRIVSPAAGSSHWQMEISRGAASQLEMIVSACGSPSAR